MFSGHGPLDTNLGAGEAWSVKIDRCLMVHVVKGELNDRLVRSILEIARIAQHVLKEHNDVGLHGDVGVHGEAIAAMGRAKEDSRGAIWQSVSSRLHLALVVVVRGILRVKPLLESRLFFRRIVWFLVRLVIWLACWVDGRVCGVLVVVV